nr:hypothetical protein [Tanacetum cinerariifolium]
VHNNSTVDTENSRVGLRDFHNKAHERPLVDIEKSRAGPHTDYNRDTVVENREYFAGNSSLDCNPALD